MVTSWRAVGLMAATSPISGKSLEEGGADYIAAAGTSDVPVWDGVPDSGPEQLLFVNGVKS